MPNITPEQFLSAMRHTVSVQEWNADLSDHVIMLLEQAGAPLIEIPEGHRITIEYDTFYEPAGEYDLEEERRNLASGRWGAYAVLLERKCECGNWNVIESGAGVVVEDDGSNHDNTYEMLAKISDDYLMAVAAELITNAVDMS